MRMTRFIIVCTILGTTPFAVAQEKPNVVMILTVADVARYNPETETFEIVE